MANQPAGPFMIEHFTAPDDRRTHLERINPIGDASPAWCPGARPALERMAREAAEALAPAPVLEPEAEPVAEETAPPAASDDDFLGLLA